MARLALVRQNDSIDCGAASPATVLRHYQMSLGLEQLRELTGTDRIATNMLALMQRVLLNKTVVVVAHRLSNVMGAVISTPTITKNMDRSPGTVQYDSPDSATDDKLEKQVVAYLVRVAFDDPTFGRGESLAEAKLGMAGMAEIVTGEESILFLFFKTVRQSISLALILAEEVVCIFYCGHGVPSRMLARITRGEGVSLGGYLYE